MANKIFLFSLQELVSLSRGKQVIAYGTGKVGKLVIPYLEQTEKGLLCGVTNSRIAKEDAGLFFDTQLSLRSIQAWRERMPDATIFITTSRTDFQMEIVEICESYGFQDIILCDDRLANDILFRQIKLELPARHQIMSELLIPHIDTHLLDYMCFANEIRDIHTASFAEFKGCHAGRTVALVASGPTLNYYTQIKGISHIGVNNTFLNPNLALNYLFATDYGQGTATWYDRLKDYNCVKFLGLGGWTAESRDLYRIPEDIIDANHGRRFYTLPTENNELHCDIEHYPLMGGSVVHAAFHFALYTRPKRILLIGCDCSGADRYSDSPGFGYSCFTSAWRIAQRFASRYYRDTEVISVNPVGLKGLFRDVYTERYLDTLPEDSRTGCEVLDVTEFENPSRPVKSISGD